MQMRRSADRIYPGARIRAHRQLIDARVPNIVSWKNRTVANRGRLSGGEAGQRSEDSETSKIPHGSDPPKLRIDPRRPADN
jgi:hypothetical protein